MRKSKVFFENMERTSMPKEANSDSGAPRPKSAPRGSKSITFSKGFGQLFELGNSSLIYSANLQFHSLNIRYTHQSELQLEKFFESEVGEF